MNCINSWKKGNKKDNWDSATELAQRSETPGGPANNFIDF